ncbi:hypothetical protein [Clostridium sp.]|uniref:hypothetical protein n=1 Tax=Clostridium sp. TaxID=1506 RepID=UPI00291537E6|nr:hypothetical protein [Clostridium sp.]MDU7241482.1 hypothetical protein [Clostridium sp.]
MIKKIISVSSFLTLFLTQTAFAASGSSVTYSNRGTSTTTTSYGGQALTATATFIYTSNQIGSEIRSTQTTTGTGPSSLSATAYTKHEICNPRRTEGVHIVNGWAEYYSGKSVGYY